MNPHKLVATDIVHAILLAIVAGLGYFFAGVVDFWILASLLVGSIPAVLPGSLLAGKISDRAVQKSLVLILLMAGVKVII